jgi:integrase
MARCGDGIYQRGASWYWESWIEGVRYRRRIGSGIPRKLALDISRKMRAEILSGNYGFGKKVKDLSYDEAWEKFDAWFTANKKAHSIRTYKECGRRLKESFSGKRLSQISSFLIEGHRQRRIKAGARVRANRELAVLKNLFSRCREWKLFEGENPVTSVKLTKEPKQRLRVLEPEEEDRLLARCTVLLRTMVLVGLYCGVRLKSEGLTLRWEDLDFVRGTVSVRAAYAKNGKERTIPINSLVRDGLERLPRRSEWVFAKPNGTPYHAVRGFRAACRKADLKDVTPHTLRHTFATRLIEHGANLREVQVLGGWSNLKMLERYGHVKQSRLAEAVERLVRNSPANSPSREIRKLVTA